MKPHTHAVVRMRYDDESQSDRYEIISTHPSLPSAKKHASTKATGTTGDIILVCDLAKVSNIADDHTDIYIINSKGIPAKPDKISKYKPHDDYTWLNYWNSDIAEADDMVDMALGSRVNTKIVTHVACLLIKPALTVIPKEVHITGDVFLEVYKQKEHPEEYWRSMVSELEDIVFSRFTKQYDLASEANYAVKLLALFKAGGYNPHIGYAVNSASSAISPMDPTGERIRMANTVREFIPLRKLLLSNVEGDKIHTKK